MDENHDRMLEKLYFILRLVREWNFTLKKIESRGEIRYIGSISSDDFRESEAIDEAELESEAELEAKMVDKPDLEPEVEESLIETHVDLLAKPVMELLPSSLV